MFSDYTFAKRSVVNHGVEFYEGLTDPHKIIVVKRHLKNGAGYATADLSAVGPGIGIVGTDAVVLQNPRSDQEIRKNILNMLSRAGLKRTGQEHVRSGGHRGGVD